MSSPMKKGTATAASILEPWLNSDPCEGCLLCENVCVKLQVRIDAALTDLRGDITRLQESAEESAKYFLAYHRIFKKKGIDISSLDILSELRDD